MEQYFKRVKPSEGTTLTATEVASVSVIRPSLNEQAQVRSASAHSKKRKASGELPQKARETQNKAEKNGVVEWEATG